MKVNNLPVNYSKYAFIVARRANGELWFWGAFNNRNVANEVAIEEGGIVFENNSVE